jgi:putative nucleotidyltransferase with HDIG domain
MATSPQISRARTKQTKSREKKAGKTAAQDTSWKNRPIFGIVVGTLVWLFSMILLSVGPFSDGSLTVEKFMDLAGSGVYLLFGLIASVFTLSLCRPDYLKGNARVLLLAAIAVVSLIPAILLQYVLNSVETVGQGVAGFLMPFAMASLLTSILLSGIVGVIVGGWVTLVIVILVGGDIPLPLLLVGLSATVVAGISAPRARTRSKVIRVGVAAGASQLALILGITATQWSDSHLPTVLYQAGACVASGFLSAILVLLILPAFERLSGITTDITMLELADLGHPLLQRLALEAPGTYHHSLVVANLAQAAADEIGENALVARVCCYFHDVGKLVKPEFFTENIGYNLNPHDSLPPTMSSLVITSHVKEGVSLAILHKLPNPVINVISEHHGTSLVSFFHNKARAQLEIEKEKKGENPAGESSTLDEWNFRYPGPKPVSRISGIIAIADALEAASRSIEKTTPAHIEGLVDEIVSSRISDGQLDNCSLTMEQLTRIRNSFARSLTSMLHGRTPYPKNENRDKQPTDPAQTGPAEVAAAGSAVHG